MQLKPWMLFRLLGVGIANLVSARPLGKVWSLSLNLLCTHTTTEKTPWVLIAHTQICFTQSLIGLLINGKCAGEVVLFDMGS